MFSSRTETRRSLHWPRSNGMFNVCECGRHGKWRHGGELHGCVVDQWNQLVWHFDPLGCSPWVLCLFLNFSFQQHHRRSTAAIQLKPPNCCWIDYVWLFTLLEISLIWKNFQHWQTIKSALNNQQKHTFVGILTSWQVDQQDEPWANQLGKAQQFPSSSYSSNPRSLCSSTLFQPASCS